MQVDVCCSSLLSLADEASGRAAQSRRRPDRTRIRRLITVYQIVKDPIVARRSLVVTRPSHVANCQHTRRPDGRPPNPSRRKLRDSRSVCQNSCGRHTSQTSVLWRWPAWPVLIAESDPAQSPGLASSLTPGQSNTNRSLFAVSEPAEMMECADIGHEWKLVDVLSFSSQSALAGFVDSSTHNSVRSTLSSSLTRQ